MAEASYPEDLLYHPEHDWARIDGEQATFGITWYAQDSLGEVVFFDPPKVGTTVTKDQPYTEVESVKAVSDVGDVLASQQRRRPERLANEVIDERFDVPLIARRRQPPLVVAHTRDDVAKLARGLAVELDCGHHRDPHFA